jgi:hypothetical protein
MSHSTFDQVIDCSGITAAECSDSLLDALGHCDALKLKADHGADIVHGSVSIVHNSPPLAHEVTVEIYDADEDPNENHDTIMRRPEPTPGTAELKQRATRKWLKTLA